MAVLFPHQLTVKSQENSSQANLKTCFGRVVPFASGADKCWSFAANLHDWLLSMVLVYSTRIYVFESLGYIYKRMLTFKLLEWSEKHFRTKSISVEQGERPSSSKGKISNLNWKSVQTWLCDEDRRRANSFPLFLDEFLWDHFKPRIVFHRFFFFNKVDWNEIGSLGACA